MMKNEKPNIYPILATDYDGQDVAGYLMSEKLDGVRAIWTGYELVSRNDIPFAAPAWFTASLPAGIALDGELYMGPGRLQEVAGALRRITPIESQWIDMTYRVFDAPLADGGFADRLEFAKAHIESCTVACIVRHRTCHGSDDMRAECARVCASGGEGVVLRDPAAGYDGSSSASMIRFKPVATDEAEVVDASGKSIMVTWHGVEFRLCGAIPSPRPAPGAMVTFKYCGLTDSGKPRNATFVAVRNYE
jgi:DNA ligase-1